jgi:hypothetical protein
VKYNRFWMWLARRLPRRLVYACVMRVGVHATTGDYSWQIVPDLTLIDALKRWDSSMPLLPWTPPKLRGD